MRGGRHILAGIALLLAGCSATGMPSSPSSPTAAATAAPSSAAGASPEAVPAGWVIRSDPPQQYSVGLPDSWDFVLRDSHTYDGDLQAVAQDSTDLAAYFKLAFGADNQLRFLGGDPHNLGNGFASNVQVIRSDLGAAGKAPSLRDLVAAKTRLLSRQTTLVQPVKQKTDVLAGRPAVRLDYVLTSAGSPHVRSYFVVVQRGASSYEYELTMGALPDAATAMFDTIGGLFAISSP